MSDAINAALSRVDRVGLPCGQYLLDKPLAVARYGTSLNGISRACVVLLTGFMSGDVITLGKAGQNLSSLGLSGVHIYAKAQRASGYALIMYDTHNALANDLIIDGPQAGILKFDGGVIPQGTPTYTMFHNVVRDFEFSSSSTEAITITNYAQDTTLAQGVVGASPTSLHIDDASGVYLQQLDLSPATKNANGKAQANIIVNPGLSQNVNALYATQVQSDSCAGDCWQLGGPGRDGTQGYISEVYLTQGWGSGSMLGTGLHTMVGAKIDGLTATDFHAHLNGVAGVDFEGGRNITVAGGGYFQNSQLSLSAGGTACGGPVKASGIHIGPGADVVDVHDVHSTSGGYMAQHGKLNCQVYGIDAGGGTDNVRTLLIHDNLLPLNQIGPFQVPTGPNIRVHDNLPGG